MVCIQLIFFVAFFKRLHGLHRRALPPNLLPVGPGYTPMWPISRSPWQGPTGRPAPAGKPPLLVFGLRAPPSTGKSADAHRLPARHTRRPFSRPLKPPAPTATQPRAPASCRPAADRRRPASERAPAVPGPCCSPAPPGAPWYYHWYYCCCNHTPSEL
jgi:hypothetical protein